MTSKDEKIVKGGYRLSDKGYWEVLPVIEKWRFKGLFQIIKEIKEVNPEWVILQYVPYMYSYYGVPVCIALFSVLLRIMQFKLITTFHEVAIRFDVGKPKYWIVFIIQRIVAYILALNSQWIIVAIKFYKNMLKIFKKKIIIIPIGSSSIPIEITYEEKNSLRKKFSFNDEIIISTFGGGLQRRYDVILKALKEYNMVRKIKPSLRVLFIGNLGKKMINLLKNMAKDLEINNYIYFTGYLKMSDVYKYLAISDIFIMIDLYEGKGGISIKSAALASAYAAGLPIIGNRGDLTDDFFQDKENIFLVDSINVEEIVSAIKELVCNFNLRNKLREGSQKTYTNYLKWEVIAKRYLMLL